MKVWLKARLPASWLRRWHIARNGRFTVLKWETDGLLPIDVYTRLHDEILTAPDLDIVEIGGASGAASIAMALALKEQRRSGRLIVAEKFEGGTRAAYGGHAENLERFWTFLRRYGVDEYVRLWDGWITDKNVAQFKKWVQTPALAGLLLDADGCIHRDLQAFWDYFTPRTRIFIDDFHPTHSKKHALTHRLGTYLLENEFLRKVDLIDTTLIARRAKPPGVAFPTNECRRLYDEFWRVHGPDE